MTSKLNTALLFLYVLLLPILSRILPAQQPLIVAIHETISSLVVAWILLNKRTPSRTQYTFGIAFFFLALADFIYGFTGEVLLDKTNLKPIIIARETSYVLFAILLAFSIGRTYRSQLKKSSTLIVITALTLLFAWVGFSKVIRPLSELSNPAYLFIFHGSVYALSRAFVLAVAIQQMAFERNMLRFLFLFAIAQMFLSEIAFLFQPNVVHSVPTMLNAWMETGWQISTAIFCVIAIAERNETTLFGETISAHWKSVRTLTVLIVTLALVIEGAWFWFFDILKFPDVFNVVNFISLGFVGWIIANTFGIAVSRQMYRVTSPQAGSKKAPNFLLEENAQVIESVLAMQRNIDEQKWLATIGKLSAQIAHDIRSPLSALNMVATTLDNIDEDRRTLIKSAINRINDIANQLLKKKHQGSAQIVSHEPVRLVSVIDALLREKRSQLSANPSITIRGNLEGGERLFANVSMGELSQVLSNIINNSIEAISEHGTINVSIGERAGRIIITVVDNGKGIPENILIRLGELGFSHGKDNANSGYGIGLNHARETIHRYGGKLEFTSKVDLGTTTTIELPKAETPKWFIDGSSVAPISSNQDRPLVEMGD